MRTLSNLIVSSGSRIASRLVATISLIVLLIGKCQSKALADVLLSSHDNNLTTEEFPLDLRVTRPDKTNQVTTFLHVYSIDSNFSVLSDKR